MTKIKINTPLKRYTKDVDILTGEGKTVWEVLLDASSDLPELKKRLFKPDNTLSTQVVIYKDMKDIRLLERGNTSVDDNTELTLTIALCGG